jgi:hypothetical protein
MDLFPGPDLLKIPYSEGLMLGAANLEAHRSQCLHYECARAGTFHAEGFVRVRMTVSTGRFR